MGKKWTEEEKAERRIKREAKKVADAEARAQAQKEHMYKTSVEQCLKEGKNAGEPTRGFEVGQDVIVGNIDKVTIAEKLEGGYAYAIDTVHTTREGTSRLRRAEPWYGIYEKRDKEDFPETIHKKKEYWISYRQTSIGELIRTVKYYFEIDDEPEYQRDLVWEEEDKVLLIDSIYRDIEIGKFVLIKLPFTIDGPGYEILDGKQRLNALCEFFEGRIKYKGLTFAEMNPLDQGHFRNFPISSGETRDTLTRKQKLEYFLRLNTRGRDQTAEHIDSVRNMLDEEIKKEKE